MIIPDLFEVFKTIVTYGLILVFTTAAILLITGTNRT